MTKTLMLAVVAVLAANSAEAQFSARAKSASQNKTTVERSALQRQRTEAAKKHPKIEAVESLQKEGLKVSDAAHIVKVIEASPKIKSRLETVIKDKAAANAKIRNVVIEVAVLEGRAERGVSRTGIQNLDKDMASIRENSFDLLESLLDAAKSGDKAAKDIAVETGTAYAQALRSSNSREAALDAARLKINEKTQRNLTKEEFLDILKNLCRNRA